MDADWYEDPLGRYDGRFFDGESWTAKVSDDGIRTTDTAFPGSSTSRESPVRVVAVLDESVVLHRAAAATRAAPAPERNQSSRGVRGFVTALAALLGLALVATAVLFLMRSDGQSTSGESVVLDQTQADRVQDLEAAQDVDGVPLDDLEREDLEVDAPPGIADSDDQFDPSETIEVGSLSIVNGASALADLAAWHEGYAEGRGVELGSDRGCWFGQLGGAAVEVAHCGPVSGSTDTEYLYDRVQVDFVDFNDGQLARPVVDVVTPNTVIANAMTLIGSADGAAPPE